MPLKPLFSILALAIVLSAKVGAHTVTPEQAQQIAAALFNSDRQGQKPSRLKVNESTDKESDEQPYYIFNSPTPGNGFAIISGDNRAPRILGYSDTGTFDSDNLPPQLSELLKQYAEQIRTVSTDRIHPSWDNKSTASAGDGILLHTADWGQGTPYNALTPKFDGTNAPTGCVPTAVAIVMKYHNWPQQGRNKWVFKHDGILVDFSESHYQFDKYKDKYNEDDELTPDVLNMAKLLHDIGIADFAAYDKNETRATIELLGHILMRYFRYSPSAHHLIRSDYDDDTWNGFIIDNLSNDMPVIYSAQSQESGHCFVIDGYKDNLYHINWGWDGRLNGYFALSALNPYDSEYRSYDFEHTMLSDVKPDYDSHDFSEVWIDTGTDRYAGPAGDEYLKRARAGAGMCIDRCDVKPGEPFNLLIQVINGPVSFEGEIAVAVMDGNNRIVDILKSVNIWSQADSPNIGYFPYLTLSSAFNCSEWQDLVYSGKIDSSMRLQLVARRTGQNWEIVNGTPLTPSGLPMLGNQPKAVNEVVTLHGVTPEYADYVTYKTNVRRINQPFSITFSSSFGKIDCFINGKYYESCGPRGYYKPSSMPNQLTYDEARNLFSEQQLNYDLYFKPYSEPTSKIIENVTPGTLSSRLSSDDILDLSRLKITGTLNNADLFALDELSALSELDLSDASIEGNILKFTCNPLYLHNVLESVDILNLPKSLKKIDGDLYRVGLDFKIVNIPASVTDCGNLRAENIVFNSPIPPSANYESIKFIVEEKEWQVPSILIVPKGSKAAYQTHPHWKHYMEIIEMDEDDCFDASIETDVNNGIIGYDITKKLRYLSIFTYKYGGMMHFKKENEYIEAATLPFLYTAFPHSINGKPISYINAWGIRPKDKNCREIHFLPGEGFFSSCTYSYNNDEKTSWLTDYQYIVTPCLKPNFSHLRACAFVPAHSSIGEEPNLTDEYYNLIWVKFEMFGMNCDKKSNTVSIAPTLDGITIDKVLINGQESTPIGTRYAVDFSNNPEISVSYTFKGLHSMTTVYSPDFIATLPHNPDEVDGVADIFADENRIISVYNLSGILLYRGEDSSLPKLPSGIYILNNGRSSRKVYLN